jgi:eukaryotic-like serine/threonine-protein kinase
VTTPPAAPMTPERWRRVDAVLQAALDRPAAERAAFVERECGDDVALRQEVESLLASSTADEFLERPAVARGATAPVDTRVVLAAALAGR